MSGWLEALESRYRLMADVLAELVPMAILEREELVWGGPTPIDHAVMEEWKRRIPDDPELMMPFVGFGARGGWLNELVKVLVVLAFQPGGVKLFGSHWVGGEQHRQDTAEVYGRNR